MKTEAYLRTCAARKDVLQVALESFARSDLGQPQLIAQPEDIPLLPPQWSCSDLAAAWWAHQLHALTKSDADLLFIFEDDITVNQHILHNTITNPCWDRYDCGCLWLSTPNGVFQDVNRLGYANHIPYRNSDALHFAGGIAITPARLALCFDKPSPTWHPQITDIFISNNLWLRGQKVFLSDPALVRHQDVPSLQNHDPGGAMSDQYFSADWRRP